MASEHIVKLKAVLDTADVKKQLQSFGQSRSANGFEGRGTDASLAASLNRLNATLTRLVATLSGQRMSGGMPSTIGNFATTAAALAVGRRLPAMAAKTAWRPGAAGAVIGPGKSGVVTDPKTGKLTLRFDSYKAQLEDVSKRRHWVKSLLEEEKGSLTPNIRHAYEKQLKGLTEEYKSAWVRSKVKLTPKQTERINKLVPVGKPSARGGFKLGGIKSAAAFGATFLLDPAANWLEQRGHGTAAQVTRSVGNIATAAGTGAMIGSVLPGVGTAAGAGIGAVIGALKEGFDYLTGKAKDAADALAKLEAQAQAGRNAFTARQEQLFTGKVKRMAMSGDEAGLESMFNAQLAEATKWRKPLQELEAKKRAQNGGLSHEDWATYGKTAKEYATAQSRLEKIASALPTPEDKSKYSSIDMTAVTSLAAMGFGMGEKDSSEERVRRFYDDSLRYQAAIERNTRMQTAVFGE